MKKQMAQFLLGTGPLLSLLHCAAGEELTHKSIWKGEMRDEKSGYYYLFHLPGLGFF